MIEYDIVISAMEDCRGGDSVWQKEKEQRLIAQNKKAYHDYFIEETIQAGISLAGTEVKSLRMGKCSLKESYIQIKDGEAFIYNMHISIRAGEYL